MRYHEISPMFHSGKPIRRSDWLEDEYIVYDQQRDQIINNENKYIWLKTSDLKAVDWGVYMKDTSQLLNTTMLRTKASSLFFDEVMQLQQEMFNYAIKHETTSDINERYHIAYSKNMEDYIVERAYGLQSPSIVCFNKVDVAEKCLGLYKPLMNKVRKLDSIRIYLNTTEMECLGIEECNEINALLDELSEK